MIFDNKPYTFDRTVRILFSLGIIVGAVWLLGYLSNVLIPFVIASLLAYVMNPTVEFFNRRLRNHTFAIVVTLTAYIGLLSLLLWLIVPIIIQQFVEMGQLLTDLLKNYHTTGGSLSGKLWIMVKQYIEETNLPALLQTEDVYSLLQQISEKLLPGFMGVLSGTASFIIGLLGLAVILLYLVFIMHDFQKLSEGWKDFIPQKYRKGVVSFTEEFNTGMKKYFRGQALIASIVGILFAIGFYIIDLPMGIILGLFIGLLNMVPYLQTIGLIPAYLFALLDALQSGSNVWIAVLLVTIVFIIVQGFQDMYLVPKIMGKVTGFSPAIILLSLSIWGKLLGFFGLIIALPMTALLVAYYRRFILTRSTEDDPEEAIKKPASI